MKKRKALVFRCSPRPRAFELTKRTVIWDGLRWAALRVRRVNIICPLVHHQSTEVTVSLTATAAAAEEITLLLTLGDHTRRITVKLLFTITVRIIITTTTCITRANDRSRQSKKACTQARRLFCATEATPGLIDGLKVILVPVLVACIRARLSTLVPRWSPWAWPSPNREWTTRHVIASPDHLVGILPLVLLSISQDIVSICSHGCTNFLKIYSANYLSFSFLLHII